MTSTEKPVKVLVDLRTNAPDHACLERLRTNGLTITRLIENKVIGTILEAKIPLLRENADVHDVERSVPLNLHVVSAPD